VTEKDVPREPCKGCGVVKPINVYCTTKDCPGHYDSEESKEFRGTFERGDPWR